MAAAAATTTTASGRRRWVGGNWKAAAKRETIAPVIDALNKMDEAARTDIVLFPTSLHVERTRHAVKASVQVGIQNIHAAEGFGAFTGEIVVPQVVDEGLSWVLVGHSERRHVFHEDEKLVAEKARIALGADLNIALCIGETLEEREAGKTLEVVTRQVEAVAAVVKPEAWVRSIIVAYEPVWAIGTGKVCPADQAQETHAHIRTWLASRLGAEAAAAVRIVYGGSVTGSNCKSFGGCPDIDGFLVGGASLKPEFIDIIRSADA